MQGTDSPKPVQADTPGSTQFSIKTILIVVGAIEVVMWLAVWLMRR